MSTGAAFCTVSTTETCGDGPSAIRRILGLQKVGRRADERPMAPHVPPAVPGRPDLGDYAWATRLRDERRERGAPTIGAIIHTRNEERNVADAVRSVSWADHVLVVDMESEDRTVEIAEALGAEVASHPNTGIVEPARNWAIEHLRTDWILVVDADERVPETLARILDEASARGEADVVEIACELWISGRHVRNSGWGNHWHNRFFRAGHVRWSDRIHCMPEVTGRVLRVPAGEGTCLVHFSYDDLHHFVEKLNRYTGKEADALEGEPTSDWPWLARFLRREFSWHYTPDEDGPISARWPSRCSTTASSRTRSAGSGSASRTSTCRAIRASRCATSPTTAASSMPPGSRPSRPATPRARPTSSAARSPSRSTSTTSTTSRS